jgi:hypothetical protein
MKCIFHIGPAKTGTSAIQAFLSRARGHLREAGYLYPSTGRWRGSHNGLFLRPGRHRLTESEMTDQFAQLRTEIAASGLDRVILSAELAANSLTIPTARKNIEQLFDGADTEVHVICFARRQDAWLDSNFKQQVQGGLHGSPWRFVRRRYKYMFFDDLIGQWAKLAHVTQVSCIPYDGSTLTAGVENFCRAAALPISLAHLAQPETVNPSLDGQRLQVRYFFNHYELDGSTDKQILRLLKRSPVPNVPRMTLFDERARNILLSIVAESNHRLETQYGFALKPEGHSRREVFRPSAPDELQGLIGLLLEQDEGLIMRAKAGVPRPRAPYRSEKLHERLNELTEKAREID